jgi:anti-sigma B factor antagonist
VFTIERRGPWAVLLLEGELDLAVGAELQRDVIDLLPTDEPIALAIDLSEVTFIDSTVIGILAMAHKRAGRNGGRLAIFGATDRVGRVLQMTGLATILDLHASWQDLEPSGVELGQELGRASPETAS